MRPSSRRARVRVPSRQASGGLGKDSCVAGRAGAGQGPRGGGRPLRRVSPG